MNITETTGTWKLSGRMITNLKTRESMVLNNRPDANAIAYMHERTLVTKCSEALATGTWPN